MKRVRNLTLCIGIITVFLCACSGGGQRTISGLNPADFDTIINNKAVKLFTLTNESGMEACITNYGGRLVSLCVPNKAGQLTDVVLGFDNIHQYADTVNTPSDFGASIGRYANRINKGQLKVGGKQFSYRPITLVTVCMAVRLDGSIKYMMRFNRMTVLCNYQLYLPMETTIFLER